MRRGPREGAFAAGVAFAGFLLLLLLPRPGPCSNAALKGPPPAPPRVAAADREPETSSVRLVFLGAIGLFQKWVSPIEGPRCGFSPSCSAFGHQAIREQGPLRGVAMTADRLMRDTVLTAPGPGYTVLPDGHYFDPVSRNLLRE
jgi:putative component of membrane protein insertase Oxa1/YidC/SpoIIIJ protein YidD